MNQKETAENYVEGGKSQLQMHNIGLGQSQESDVKILFLAA